jgi:hypothetical protein
VTIAFDVTPKNATVLVNGKAQHGSLVTPKSDKPITIEVQASGYETEKRTLVADASSTVEAKLKPIPKPQPAATKPQPTGKPQPIAKPTPRTKPAPAKSKPQKKGKKDNMLFGGDDL